MGYDKVVGYFKLLSKNSPNRTEETRETPPSRHFGPIRLRCAATVSQERKWQKLDPALLLAANIIKLFLFGRQLT